MDPLKKSDLQEKLDRIAREAEERDAKRRSQSKGAPYVDIGVTPVSIEAVKLIPEALAKKANAVALQLKVDEIAVAFLDVNAPEAKEVVDLLEGKKYKVKKFTASRSGLEQIWKMYEFVAPPAEKITGNITIEKERIATLVERFKFLPNLQEDISKIDFMRESTTDFFEVILAGALANKVSDVHMDAGEKETNVRFRMDGLLRDIAKVPPKNYLNLVSRIKLLSELKINVRDEPQDGRFTIRVADQDIEVRVSLIPSEFGETVVMRILDPAAISVTLEQLGLRPDDLVIVERNLARPNGLLLNTGPTGSGKTTTLYAFLRHVATRDIKVITVEDPIEYRIDGIEQTQVDPEVGYTFASGLRSILRQDPDVILIGEIRDGETADIALQAALTGHIVFSTLHTNDAIGAVPRLIDLGVKAATIGPALALVIAQRLIRKLCPHCKKKVPVPPELKEKIRTFFDTLPSRVARDPYSQHIGEGESFIYEAAGCDKCNNFGYKGRIGIFEFLEAGTDFEDAILSSSSASTLRKMAQDQQMVKMQEDGILKILAGTTTVDEVESVTGPLQWAKK